MIEQKCFARHLVSMANAQMRLLSSDLADEMRPERIGYRMMLVREALGLKPSEMADLLDIERTYWSRFERGNRKISDEVAAMLFERFDVSLDFLILGRWNKLPLDLAQKMREVEASLPK